MTFIFGNRIPYEYFITKGKGESEAGSEGLPYETGSYDAALSNAGIENVNVIEYTSVMPTNARQISKQEGLSRIQWGEVLECIKAQSNGKKGTKISAAVITTTVINPKGEYLGGFACEYSGSGTKADAQRSLLESIGGMIKRRGYGTFANEFKMRKDNKTSLGYIIYPGKIFEYDCLDVKEEHGSVFVAICFVSYNYPAAINNNNSHKYNKTKRRRPAKKTI